MKYSVTIYGTYDKFNKVMDFFNTKYFGDNPYEDGDDFLYGLGEYLDGTKYPCNKIKLSEVFTGYNNRIRLYFYYNDEKISYVDVEFMRYGLYRVYSYAYYKKDLEMFHNIIEQYFNDKKQMVLKHHLEMCHIQNDKNNKIKVDDYRDYKPNGQTEVLTGSIEVIFDTYTTHNDRLRYCNGMYWRFSDKNIAKLYDVFVNAYNGNYFLDNAVKRGVTID